MRFGPLAIRLLALLAAACAGGELAAQSGGGSNYQPPSFQALGRSTTRPVQAMFLEPVGLAPANPYVDAYGNSVVVPASYCGDDCGSECYGGDCGYPPSCNGYGDCPDGYGGDGFGYGCGGHGGGGYGGRGYGGYGYGGRWQDPPSGTYPPFPPDVENYSLLPPGRTEQCGPHYFDVRMEAVFMTRDETFRDQIDFSANGLQPSQVIVLSSSQLDFEVETGFRIMGRYDVGPLSVVEFGYWGLENLDASASFTDPTPVDEDTGSLYSLFTNFVQNPALLPPTVTQPDGALPWTERSITHRISLESELQTGEFTYRRYWVGFNPMLSGTLLAGFRFTRLREDFRFQADGEARGRYEEGIKNDLAGFQTGGDVWLQIRQGVRIGAEGKIGLMNNHYTLDNTFSTDPVAGTPPDFTEHFEKDQPALTVEASADFVWDVCPSWSVRAGYEILFLNSVLLAGENFNTGTVYNGIPGVLLPERIPFVNDQGDAFYHGAHIGAEYIW